MRIRFDGIGSGDVSSFDASNDRLLRYKLKNGTHALIEAMMRDSKTPLSASTRLAKIESTHDGAAVQYRVGSDLTRARGYRDRADEYAGPNRVQTRALAGEAGCGTGETRCNRSTKVWYKLKQPHRPLAGGLLRGQIRYR